ncbi:MAG: DUF4405 domain-containing protein [Chlorobiaceae bacterium]|jgi:hypothetical protein|nr:DUF4405 domain-containing protein [Chlorobiaceae bacterium]
MNATLKSLATPVAAGAFFISAITGTLIFFDVEIGAVEPVHKWLSWLLLGGIMLHVLTHWNSFSGYFSRKPALAVIGMALAVAGGSMLPVFGEDEEGEKRTAKAAVYALESASLETVAQVVKSRPEELTLRLKLAGITVSSPAATITEIASSNSKESEEVLGAILGGGTQKD